MFGMYKSFGESVYLKDRNAESFFEESGITELKDGSEILKIETINDPSFKLSNLFLSEDSCYKKVYCYYDGLCCAIFKDMVNSHYYYYYDFGHNKNKNISLLILLTNEDLEKIQDKKLTVLELLESNNEKIIEVSESFDYKENVLLNYFSTRKAVSEVGFLGLKDMLLPKKEVLLLK